MRRHSIARRFAPLLLAVLSAPWLQAQAPAPAESPSPGPPAQQASAAIPAPQPPEVIPLHRYRIEAGSFDNVVSNGFGHWFGGTLSFSANPSDRIGFWTSFTSQNRPGETEHNAGAGTLINWTPWFYTNLGVSGFGPDDPAAFFPRFRYDATANLKLPPSGLILFGGITRLYYGRPSNLRIIHAGAILYAGQWVFQGGVDFNNSRPGEHKSTAGNGAVQFGQEGRYWLGLRGGGGREAWQTLTRDPQTVEFRGYSGSVFFRKWLTSSFGMDVSYSYYLKRTAYRIHGTELKFFFEF